MKESKFIELLNLYVDQQIEPEQAALLEAEIQRNPARRKVYQQYCRMQRACALLVEQARPEVSVGEKLADSVAAADEKVMEFPEEQSKRHRLIYIGGLLAACFTVLFLAGRSIKLATFAPVPSKEQIVQINPAALTKDSLSGGKINYQPVLVTHSLRLSNNPTGSAVATSNDQLSLDWINQVKFSPVSIANEEFALGSPSAPKKNSRDAQPKVYPGTSLSRQVEETNALQYQR